MAAPFGRSGTQFCSGLLGQLQHDDDGDDDDDDDDSAAAADGTNETILQAQEQSETSLCPLVILLGA